VGRNLQFTLEFWVQKADGTAERACYFLNPAKNHSVKGTAGICKHRMHVVPSGLKMMVIIFHGLTPVATTCRPFGAKVSSIGRKPPVLWCKVRYLGAKSAASAVRLAK